jgi:hypothetical protein
MNPEPSSPRPVGPRGTPAFYASKPTRSTLFWRTFLPWQIWRFVWINLKMFRIIAKSHAGSRATSGTREGGGPA